MKTKSKKRFTSLLSKLNLKKVGSNPVEIFLYLLPSIIIIGFVFLVPMLDIFRFSLYDVHTIAGVRGFVGINNYKSLLTPEFLATFWRTIVYVIGAVPISIILGLLMSVILNQDYPGKRIFWILAFIPWTIPNSISAILWRWMIHSEYGLLNYILVSVGILEEPMSFLTVDLAMATNIGLRIWKTVPFATITFIAGLQTIPEELYEASSIDGATWWQKLIYITLPSLRNITMTTALLLGIWGFINFDLIWVLTQGGPIHATETIPLAIYRLAFQEYKSGLASAMGVFYLFIILLFSIVYFKITERKED